MTQTKAKAPSYWSFLWQPTVFYGLNSLVLSYLVLFHTTLNWIEIAACLGFGIFLWTALEYATHRFLLHIPARFPKWYPLTKYLHIGHHEESEDPNVFIIPLPFTIVLYGSIFLGLWGVSGRLDYTFCAMISTMVSYVAFEWFHSYIHLYEGNSALMRAFRRYHYVHHYKDESRHFGVTSAIWDYVFRTN